MVGRSLHAEVSRQVHERGLTWRFSIPVNLLDPNQALNGDDPPPGDK
jgi:hypothetical protein